MSHNIGTLSHSTIHNMLGGYSRRPSWRNAEAVANYLGADLTQVRAAWEADAAVWLARKRANMAAMRIGPQVAAPPIKVKTNTDRVPEIVWPAGWPVPAEGNQVAIPYDNHAWSFDVASIVWLPAGDLRGGNPEPHVVVNLVFMQTSREG